VSVHRRAWLRGMGIQEVNEAAPRRHKVVR
jgi:hypothetical protein